MPDSPALIHATCVAIDGMGVLLRGAPGAGKSDLALRLIDDGATLVADDQVALSVENARVVARAPAALRGMLEVRGLDIVALSSLDAAPVVLEVELVTGDAVERLPERQSCERLGVTLRWIALRPFEASAPAKVRLAARLATRDIKSATKAFE